MINAWRVFQEYWDKQENVITIRYEDLYNDTFATLKKVLIETGYKIEDKDIERAINEHPRQGVLYKHIASFHPEDRALVESRLGDLLQKYRYDAGDEEGR